MTRPPSPRTILLQTTIAHDSNDWAIERFSQLTMLLTGQRGRAIAQSSFHHFADYNWQPGA